MPGTKDYYKLLELSKTANQDEIKKSYHRLAKKFHPDKNPNNPESAEKFKTIKEAYEILSDPVKKTDYDRSTKTPQSFTTSSKNQTRYQTSNFPNVFTTSRTPAGPGSSRGPGPRVFAFNIYGNAGSPFADILKMFFGGMSDFGPGPNFPREPRRTAPNPNAAALCQFCRQLFTVEQLIQHQNNCPLKPTTPEDFENLFPGNPGMSSQKPHDWRQQHKDTLESIRRDRERAGGSNQKQFPDQFDEPMNFEYEYHKSGLVQCPSCNRRFNMEAASHHIPFCRQKANESQFQHNTPTNDHKQTRENSFQRAKEYAKNLKKDQQENGNNQWNYSDFFYDSDNGNSLFSEDSISRSDSENENNSYFQFNSDSFSDFFSARNVRKTTLPDVSFTNRKTPLSNRSRRNSSNDVYGTPRSDYFGTYQQNYQKSSRGCNNCIRVYGFEAAKIHCSCGLKRATNMKHH